MLEKFDREKNGKRVIDSLGRGLTVSMFHETNDERTEYKPIWYLKDWKEVYLHLSDPTEYAPAMYLIGSWEHWQRIADRSQVRAHITEWRKELIVKIRSDAVRSLQKQAMGDKGTTAAKWLAENGFILDSKTKREVERETDAMFKDVVENATRLKVVNSA